MRKAAVLRWVVTLPVFVMLICCSRQQLLAQDTSTSTRQVGSRGVAEEGQLTAAAQAKQEEELRAAAAKITKETKAKQKQLTDQEKKRLKLLAEQRAKEEREFMAQQKKAAQQKKERQKQLAEQEIKRQQELEVRQKELARDIEEKRRQIVEEEARRLQEIRMKQEELARQIEERQRQIVEKEARRLQELREKEAELSRMREENLRKIAEERARKQMGLAKLEQERQAREARLQQELQAKREKEARAREEARRKEQKLQEEAARREEMERQRFAEARMKQQEAQAKREREEKLRQERLAKEREARDKQLAAEKIRQEQELRNKQEQLAREKEWREKQLAEERIRQEKEWRFKQEQAAKEKLTKQKQAAELKAQQERMAWEKEKWQRKMAEEEGRRKQDQNVQKEKELQTKQMQALLDKEKRLREQAEQKAKREEELRLKQEQLTQQKLWQEKQLAAEKGKKAQEQKDKMAAMKAKHDQELWANQQLVKEKEIRQQHFAEIKSEPEKAARVSKPVPAAAPQASGRRADAQEKAMSQATSTKHVEDAEKIRLADELWVRARKLYSMGLYKEAVRDFQEIIKIEGNPRIKYTPSAKGYIEKANAKMEAEANLAAEKKIEEKDKEMLDEVVIRQLAPYVEPPSVVEKASETSLVEPPVIRKLLKEKKISMDFDQVDLKSVISFLSQESGINFVASQKVLEMGLKVTARFDQTPIYEVTKYITKSLGLLYRIDKEVVWIAHPEEIAQESLETRVYYLTKGGGLFTEFSGSAGGGTESGLGSSSASISKIYTIEDTLKEVVSWPQDAKLTFDKRINALIVRNTPQNLQMLEDILYSLDITPSQILIEAKFLEVDVTDTKEFGLEWKFANEDFPTTTKNGSLEQGIAKDSGSQFSAFSRASEGLNLTYKGVLTTPQFETVLHALEESKKIKTLSSPRITTLNNQMATIKVVDEWIYPTRYDYEIVQFDVNGDGDYNDAGETTYKNVPKDFIRRDVGILLKVIPSIGADKKTVSLSLIPEVSEATADFFAYTGDVKLPKFTSRNLSTSIVVNSGDTVVLGGLIKENRTKILTKVPFMADIPLLGAFFRKNTDSIERKNLIIFVTAKVLTPAGEEIVVANAR